LPESTPRRGRRLPAVFNRNIHHGDAALAAAAHPARCHPPAHKQLLLCCCAGPSPSPSPPPLSLPGPKPCPPARPSAPRSSSRACARSSWLAPCPPSNWRRASGQRPRPPIRGPGRRRRPRAQRPARSPPPRSSLGCRPRPPPSPSTPPAPTPPARTASTRPPRVQAPWGRTRPSSRAWACRGLRCRATGRA
jgi:hypothetical protein